MSQSNQRAKFEAYMLGKYQKPEMGGDWAVWKDDAGTYIYMQAEWECWLASRSAALEEAAQEAENFRSSDKAVNLTAREIITSEIADDIASAIRAAAEVTERGLTP
jgi:hypothetical protein